MFKKTISVTLSLLFISNFFVGCKENSLDKKDSLEEIKIGVSVYEKSDAFICSIIENLENIIEEKELENKYKFTLTIDDAKKNQYNQNEQVDNFIDQDYDVMCINLVDRRSASFIIDKAKNSNIPVVFFNREPVEEDMNLWDRIHYVGAKAEESGIIQGDIILDIYNKDKKQIDKNNDSKIQYVMLEGEAEHQDSLIRTEYSVKRLLDNGLKVEKLESDIANWNRNEACEKMDKWINEHGDKIEVVFSNNDEMALGAIEALKKSEIKDMPIIVGVDGISEALEAIKDRSLTGTVFSDSYKQAEIIFKVAYMEASLEGSKEEREALNKKYIRNGYKAVTKENIDSIIEY